MVDSQEALAMWVAEGVRQPRDWLNNAIICPTNDAVNEANALIHAMHVQREEGEEERQRGQGEREEEHAAPGDSRSYVSEDAVFTDDPDTQDMVTDDFLHETTPSGMPPHILEVRENTVLMTPRNLAPDVGLCNGTRVRVLRTIVHSIQVQILQTGQRCFVPRNTMTSTEESDLPFILQRKQLPVTLGFALTIHKCQAQSFRGRVGLWLSGPVFAHGHLYVAFSRNCAVHISDQGQGREGGWWRTNNVVSKAVLGRSTTTTADEHDSGRSRTLQERLTPATPTATTAAPERHGTDPPAAAPGPPDDARHVEEGAHASAPGAGGQEDHEGEGGRRGRRRTAWRWHHHWTDLNSSSIRATLSTRTCACRKHPGPPGATARRTRRRRSRSTTTSHRWKTSTHRMMRTRQCTRPRRRTVWSTG